MKKIKNELLGIDFDQLIRESIDQLFEVAADESKENMAEKLRQKEKENHKDSRKQKLKKQKEGSDVGDEAEDTPVQKPVSIKHEKLPEIDEEAIAEKINSIRSGKSLKEEETMKALTAYFQKLNGPERIALFAFLAGLEKVLGELSTDVKTPHSKPFSIDMEKEEPKEKEVKPKGTKQSSTNDSGENPIIVGESQDKRNILKVIKAKRRR